MGVHCGEGYLKSSGLQPEYSGNVPKMTSYIGSIAKGGQILVTKSVLERINIGKVSRYEVFDLGCHLLKYAEKFRSL